MKRGSVKKGLALVRGGKEYRVIGCDFRGEKVTLVTVGGSVRSEALRKGDRLEVRR